jgi:hypothetical protein
MASQLIFWRPLPCADFPVPSRGEMPYAWGRFYHSGKSIQGTPIIKSAAAKDRGRRLTRQVSNFMFS